MKKNDYSKLGRRFRHAKRHHNEEVYLREGFDRLRRTVNKFFHDGDTEWSPDNVMKVIGYAADIQNHDFRAQLMLWQEQGYIKIVDTAKCLFRVLKPFEESE